MKEKEYDLQLSNIKGILIFLVMLGHYLLTMGPKQVIPIDIIYSFHMPAFIFISGIFSQNVTFKKIGRILGLFIIFQPLFILFGVVTGYYKDIDIKMLITPAFHLWYLLALAVWMLFSMYANKRGKYAFDVLMLVLILFVAAVGNRYFYGTQFLTITRILSFFPYFIIGFYLNRNGFDKVRNVLKKYKYICGIAVIILIVILYFFFSKQPNEFLYLFYGFLDRMAFSSTTFGYLVNVFASFVLAFTWIALLIAVVPTRRTIFNVIGSNTLYPYILHPIIFYLMMTKQSFFINQTFAFQFVFTLLITIAVYSIFTMILKKQNRFE
ncbi:acyltransferase family protein [Listeria monocytogenes]|uniref:acyltransferase family protein n=1 Tax=Listeria monocytogenes TaxID=1639 RepID=UPI0010E80968|nr:acyltransferase family protein [Listeria monocytogenes]EAC8464468.1 acyltransferase [Listeria monocytogenes]EHM3340700.1 acyltransferase family protein [Listeria monocytogenes]EHM3395744.1 acyltransferase family protein [Listeria monocytogenes]